MSADIEDSGPALAQRVAAVEADTDTRLSALERRMIAVETALLKRGDLTINGVRAILGLPEMAGPSRVSDRRDDVTLKELRDRQLANGIITDEEHALLTERDACRE